jgi:ABC-type dipeptide/oligopeptide/nickel transport system ATPase subunit
MISTLILTGTCGSGKTTISTLLANQQGWKRISEDEIWKQYFHKNRGAFGTDEHRLKRQRVHQTPPEAYHEYREFFEKYNIEWRICVLHPRLEIAIAGDSCREDWVAGPERIEKLRAKFNGKIFNQECFIDNSDDTPEQTMLRIIQLCAA